MIQPRLDYEKVFHAFERNNKRIIGIFKFQYPVYCIHTTITDSTSEPLDHFDSLIVKMIASKTDVSSFVLSSLLGVSRRIIESRIQMLVAEDLLVQESRSYSLTEKAVNVYLNKSAERIHTRSYDFYVDGLTLSPLKKVFYKNYKGKLVSEDDNYFRTNKKGERYIERSMKPDIVHSPLDTENVITLINDISLEERESFGIPQGFIDITDLSHTKMTFQVFVAASTDGHKIFKEMIDGFAAETFLENSDYYSDIKANIKSFENNISAKIQNLIFQFQDADYHRDGTRRNEESLISNWLEIDKFPNYADKIFSQNFSAIKNIVKQKIGIDISDDFLESEKTLKIIVDVNMLKNSYDRTLLVQNLMRGRDYINDPKSTRQNVLLLYFYFEPANNVVETIMELNSLIKHMGANKIRKEDLLRKVENCPTTLKQLLLLGGNYELLERFDIEEYMSVN